MALKARLIGAVCNKRVFRVPVVVQFNSSHLCKTLARLQFTVIAHNPAEAANWARDQFSNRPETEVFAFGPQGGATKRYIGWESAIWDGLCSQSYNQLKLF